MSESLLISTFFVPKEGNTRTQTFLFVRPVKQFQLGLAYIWANESVRLIGSYELLPQAQSTPGLSAGFAFQDAFENKASPFAVLTRRFVGQSIRAEGYWGATQRPNEEHLHLIGGVKVSLGRGLYGGVQYTGHNLLSYVGVALDRASLALWVRENQRPGLSLSLFLHRH